jgi:hypothetical protein
MENKPILITSSLLFRPFTKAIYFFRSLGHKSVSALRAIVPVIRRLRRKTWLIRGHELVTQQVTCITFFGDEIDRHFWAHKIFGDKYEEIFIGRKWLWEFTRLSKYRSEDISLTIADIPGFMFKIIGGKDDFYIPLWVFGKADFQILMAMLNNSKLYTSLSSDVRKIQSNQFHYEVSRKEEDFKEFYYELYHPFITKRWDNRAFLGRYDLRHQSFKKGELLFVKYGDERIAASLFTYSDQEAELIAVGIRQDGTDYVHMGAMSALYYFGFKHLMEKGYLRVNLGGSRAFLNDGVLRYKKKWGLRITTGGWLGYLLRIRSKDAAIDSWLINNPFICKRSESLCGAVFLPPSQAMDDDAVKKLFNRYYYPGLDSICFYQIYDGHAGKPFSGSSGLMRTLYPSPCCD